MCVSVFHFAGNVTPPHVHRATDETFLIESGEQLKPGALAGARGLISPAGTVDLNALIAAKPDKLAKPVKPRASMLRAA